MGCNMGVKVKSGLDLLVEDNFSGYTNKKSALLSNPTGVDSAMTHIADHLNAHTQLTRIFAPEHGLFADAQDMAHVGDTHSERYRVPVRSLYGAQYDTLHMNPKDLEDIDILFIDIQDIGSRYYTFAYTAAFALRACAASNTHCVVLDRPNPITGTKPFGSWVEPKYKSFVGEYSLPNRTGWTLGELMHFFKDADKLECSLEVIDMAGWNRSMFFDQTGLPWVMPSPNMPTLDTAIVYPGGCLIEGTNLSEGRGTTRPFELVGAPYIQDPFEFQARVASHGLKGAMLRPTYFTPMFQKHYGKLCAGLQVHIHDRRVFDSMKVYSAIIYEAFKEPGFDWRRETYEFVDDRLAMDLLFGSTRERSLIEGGASFDELWSAQCAMREQTQNRHQRYANPNYSNEA